MSDLNVDYENHIGRSSTYITTYTVDANTPREHEYDAMNVELPDLLDAIAAEGLPVACPECGVLASLSVPLKNPMQWEVNTSHKNECSAVADRPRFHLVKEES